MKEKSKKLLVEVLRVVISAALAALGISVY